MIEFDNIEHFCRHVGLNHTNRPTGNDDSFHDIKEFMFYQYDEFNVKGFKFIKGNIQVPRPMGRVYGYSVFNQ